MCFVDIKINKDKNRVAFDFLHIRMVHILYFALLCVKSVTGV